MPWCRPVTYSRALLLGGGGRGGWSRRGEAMRRRSDIWRCEFEEFVRLKQRWCELLEAEAREEKESDSKTEEDRPPASRASTPAASGDGATFAPEKVASRRQAVAEEKGGVVEQKRGRSEVAWKLEKGSQPFDVAAMTDLKRSDVELPYDASGVGARGVEFAVGTTRPRARVAEWWRRHWSAGSFVT